MTYFDPPDRTQSVSKHLSKSASPSEPRPAKMVGCEALRNGNEHFGIHDRNNFCEQRGCVAEPRRDEREDEAIIWKAYEAVKFKGVPVSEPSHRTYDEWVFKLGWQAARVPAAPAQPVPPRNKRIQELCAKLQRESNDDYQCPHKPSCKELEDAAPTLVLTPASNAITKCAETSKCVHGVRLKDHCAECPQSPPLLEAPVLTQPSAESSDFRCHICKCVGILRYRKADICVLCRIDELEKAERPVLPVPPASKFAERLRKLIGRLNNDQFVQVDVGTLREMSIEYARASSPAVAPTQRCPSCGSREKAYRLCMIENCGEPHFEETVFSSTHMKAVCSDSWHTSAPVVAPTKGDICLRSLNDINHGAHVSAAAIAAAYPEEACDICGKVGCDCPLEPETPKFDRNKFTKLKEVMPSEANATTTNTEVTGDLPSGERVSAAPAVAGRTQGDFDTWWKSWDGAELKTLDAYEIAKAAWNNCRPAPRQAPHKGRTQGELHPIAEGIVDEVFNALDRDCSWNIGKEDTIRKVIKRLQKDVARTSAGEAPSDACAEQAGSWDEGYECGVRDGQAALRSASPEAPNDPLDDNFQPWSGSQKPGTGAK